jgi:hypothetical protein
VVFVIFVISREEWVGEEAEDARPKEGRARQNLPGTPTANSTQHESARKQLQDVPRHHDHHHDHHHARPHRQRARNGPKA